MQPSNLKWAGDASSTYHGGVFIPTSTVDPSIKLYPTPDSGGDKRVLVPATIISSSQSDDNPYSQVTHIGVHGELDNVYWVTGVLGVSSEDTIATGTDRYVIFQNGNRTSEWGFMAIKAD